MSVRLPSISTISPTPLDGFAICDSRGRRVSLLNDDDSFNFPYQCPSPCSCPSSPASASKYSASDLPCNSFVYGSPSTRTSSPPLSASSPHLPPVNDLISFTIPSCDIQHNGSRKSSVSSVSNHSRRSSVISAGSRRSSGHSSESRGTKRRYECTTCGKTFTTSGHVARHNRIHTGEKNFQCPEPGCTQRFSRQDNCMQHYRTHKSHANFPPESVSSSEWIPSLKQSPNNKRKRSSKGGNDDVPLDPNDRLSALATYISVYA